MKKLTTATLAALLIASGCQDDSTTHEKDSPSSDPSGVAFDQLGEFYIGSGDASSQSFIHSYIPSESDESSVVMVPGLGLSSYIYNTTPDGRNGWAYYFAEDGHPVYTVDTSDLVVSGLNPEPFQAVKSGDSDPSTQPSLSGWEESTVWSRWGFGESEGNPYDDTQYPTESIDQFFDAIPPQISQTNATGGGQSNSTTQSTQQGQGKANGGQRGGTDTAGGKSGSQAGGSSRANTQEVENMIKLLEDKGPSVLLVHSMGGEIGYEVARQRPELVKALVAIEPVGSPTDEEEVKKNFADIPYLVIYGDYIESRNQTGRLEATKTTAKIIRDNGGAAEVIELTKEGINGNTHIMMQDKNNKEIADIITNWLDENVDE